MALTNIRITTKSKSSSSASSSSGGSTGLGSGTVTYISGTAKEADHAKTADYATAAGTATTATRAETAAQADLATEAAALTSTSEDWNKILRKDQDDETTYQLTAAKFISDTVNSVSFTISSEGWGAYIIDEKSYIVADNMTARSQMTTPAIAVSDSATFGGYTSGLLGAGAFLGLLSGGDSYLEVDQLLVRKVASYFKLDIKRITYTGGQIILSPASLTTSSVERIDSNGDVIDDSDTETEVERYRCYFETTDNLGNTITNDFAMYDMVRCQTYNLSEDNGGSQRYWWRAVVNVGTNYIDLANYEGYYDSLSDAPQAGDEGVLIGNLQDTDRQSAIILSTVGTDAPSIKGYKGINTFSLTEDMLDWYFSKDGNRITGTFVSEAYGKTLEEVIEDTNNTVQSIIDEDENEYTIWFGTLNWNDVAATAWPSYEPSDEWDAYDDNEVYIASKHLGDMYYNTNSTEGEGGRAFRFVKSDDGVYYWDEITDADTIAALEQAASLRSDVDKIADDGVISAGSEKNLLLLAWQDVVETYWADKNVATNRSLTEDTIWTNYADAVFILGTMLNGDDPNGTPTYSETNLGTTPAWLDDDGIGTNTVLSETSTNSASEYREYWNQYYEYHAAWNRYISNQNQTQYTSVTSRIENLGDSIEAYTEQIGYVQKTDDDGNLLYYDADGNETTASTRTETDADGNETTVNNDKVLVTYYTVRNGLVTTADYAKLQSYFVDENGDITEASLTTFVTQYSSGITMTADQIYLNGTVTVNDALTIDEDGNIYANNAKVTGRLTTTFEEMSNQNCDMMAVTNVLMDTNSYVTNDGDTSNSFTIRAYKVRDTMNMDCTYDQAANLNNDNYDEENKYGAVVLPCFDSDGVYDSSWIGTRIVLVNHFSLESNGTLDSRQFCSKVMREDGRPIFGIKKNSTSETFPTTYYGPTIIEWCSGIVELICGPSTNPAYTLDWYVVNHTGCEEYLAYNSGLTIGEWTT